MQLSQPSFGQGQKPKESQRLWKGRLRISFVLRSYEMKYQFTCIQYSGQELALKKCELRWDERDAVSKSHRYKVR